MLRLFPEHEIRIVQSLDGLWTLKAAGEERTAPVPGVWESLPGLGDWRGTAEYRRGVSLPRRGGVLLRFGGVSHTARVYWDGREVGGHYNAFTGFDILIPEAEAGAHTLTVAVDNRFSPESALHIPNDYMTYGGITRPVEAHMVEGAYIQRTAFYARETGEGAFEVHARVWVYAMKGGRYSLTVDAAGGSGEAHMTLSEGETGSEEVIFGVQNVSVWDQNSPNLYRLRAVLGQNGVQIDNLFDRVGFRTVEVAGEDILLNHKKLTIRGFNRHEDWGQFGCAVPPQAMALDLELMRDMGGNSVRTCHYPNDQRFLDLCDEMGMLVWEEHHARAIPGEILRTETFERQISDCNREMIAQHVNHPCIYVWGVLNECESETEFGRGVYEKNLRQLREMDPTRPVTFATCRHYTDVCLDLADIVSWNLYPLWYTDEDPEKCIRDILAWSDGHGAKGKPCLVSEIGAGAIPGYHDPLGRVKWSEERQADILQFQLSAALRDKRLSGVYVWQFADCRVCEEKWFSARPRTMNNKGVVDEFRRPKMGYAAVKKAFEG